MPKGVASRDRFLTGLLAVVMVMLILMLLALPPREVGYTEKKTFELVNEERVAAGLEPLEWDDRIAEVARQHSRYMAENNYFGHADANGNRVDDRLRKAGITAFTLSGENIHKSFVGNADRMAHIALNNWVNSASHYATLTRPKFTHTGIGVAKGGTFYYFTQVFVEKTS
ncbi:MAG: CAP domain-containing protein [Candidatus Micrarchaeota archaeon]